MKNKNFLYSQYNKVNWQNQKKTNLSFDLHDYVAKKIISRPPTGQAGQKGDKIAVFDIGIGIGFFLELLYQNLKKRYRNIVLEGCEPSKKNYTYFVNTTLKQMGRKIPLRVYNKTFLKTRTKTKFDFITATYVFVHFVSGDLEKSVKKIHSMLNKRGKFVLILAEQKSIERRLKNQKNLVIKRGKVSLNGKKYEEILHYTDIYKIGRVVDYDREESFYIDLFKKNKFILKQKKNINQGHGYISTIFVFEKI